MKKLLRYTIKGIVLEIELTKLDNDSPWMGRINSGILDIIKRKSLYGQAHKGMLNIRKSIHIILEKGIAGLYYYNRIKKEYILLWELNKRDYIITNENDDYVIKYPWELDNVLTTCSGVQK